MAALDAAASIEVARATRRRSLGWVFWLAIAWIVIVLLGALGADLLPILDPAKISLVHRRQPPSAMYLFGTDQLGRDVLARVIYASRSSLTVGLVSAFLGLLAGGILGVLAGYFPAVQKRERTS